MDLAKRAALAIERFGGTAWLLLDSSMDVLWASREATELFGTDPVARSARELVHPDDATFVSEVLRYHQRVDTGEPRRSTLATSPMGAQLRVRSRGGWQVVLARLDNRFDDPEVAALVVRLDRTVDHGGFGRALDHLAADAPAELALHEALAFIQQENARSAMAIVWWDDRGRHVVHSGMDATVDQLAHPLVYEGSLHHGDVTTLHVTTLALQRPELTEITELAWENGFESAWIVPLRGDDADAPVGVLLSWNARDYELQLRPQMAITVGSHLCSLILNEHLRRSTLRAAALHDPLTGLMNRAGLDEAMGRIDPASDLPVATMFIDLDNFKGVNDLFGHRAGDEHLCEVAARLSASCRGRDFVARLGGDEFVMVCTEIDATADIEAMARRVLSTLNREGVAIQASIGVALSFQPSDVDTAIDRADAALARAKQSGKATIAIDS
jgi:diguanylate cyclase (GGDEF)-like protein